MTTAPGARRHHLVARFPDADAARRGMLELERAGVDGNDIHLDLDRSVASKGGLRRADGEVAGAVGRRYAGGAVAGALIGAVVIVAVLLLAGIRPVGAAVAIGALTGGTGGFFVGGYWGVARRLPVNPEAYDTDEVDPAAEEPVTVEVDVSDDQIVGDLVAVLEQAGAARVERPA